MRRLPKQARSKAKVAAIVQAAIDMLRESGYEALSTADIAQRAGVSVGTLYQFFDNKDDLMEAIAEQHANAMQEFRQQYFGADAVYVPPEILVGRTFDWLIAHNTEYPTFHQLFGGNWSDTHILDQLNATMFDIISDLARILRHHNPTLAPEQSQLGATVLVSITKGMFGILDSAESHHHPALIAELKRMALLYFNDLVHETPLKRQPGA